ncbi:1,2-phenylacetyl-CoA epoxidase subunit PaaC [Rubeoparvulum massiliense]|uniref:1,2-phenylacetyl-CoA epoxidase subunit PaaC n=1 Tax=Rubeoparvulum massiliense TaxID=1631346 RepID=UPI00065E821E|nr:1,2-phenylacetyl-CoA epoxidase subunit PaaC [Rubeoparvulum massiliense]
MKQWQMEDALQDPDYAQALQRLLFQLADDDLILAYRGAEWLGLVPHIEEDVAYSSISQDLMGHANAYMLLLEQLGVGKVDQLAHLRSPEQFHNAVLLELPNGPGHYLQKPAFDWAFTVVRNWLYTLAKEERLRGLEASSYTPLRQLAKQIQRELVYHRLHWCTWLQPLLQSTTEARIRMEKAFQVAWQDAAGLFSMGEEAMAEQLVRFQLTESGEVMAERWTHQVKKELSQLGYEVTEQPGMLHGDGRKGEHTHHLTEALQILCEVYGTAPEVAW